MSCNPDDKFDSHYFILHEDGYGRAWHLKQNPNTGQLEAYDDWFTDGGDGQMYLHCYDCGKTVDVSDQEIEYT